MILNVLRSSLTGCSMVFSHLSTLHRTVIQTTSTQAASTCHLLMLKASLSWWLWKTLHYLPVVHVPLPPSNLAMFYALLEVATRAHIAVLDSALDGSQQKVKSTTSWKPSKSELRSWGSWAHSGNWYKRVLHWTVLSGVNIDPTARGWIRPLLINMENVI